MRLKDCLIGVFLFVNVGFAESVERPQEPKKPYPYEEEEVEFKNAAAGITLAGTLTLPRADGPFPAVILLHGSAPLDRDSSLFGHKPFLVWADYLTRAGIAVLRFDKRSAGKSTGNYTTSTLQDFASDALAAIEYLKTRPEIQQIGLIGHSEGGMTATLAASKSKDVAFVVLMAAPCTNLQEVTLLQETLLQRADNVDEEMIGQNRKIRERVFALLKEENNREIAENKLRGVLGTYLDKLLPKQRKIAETYYGPLEKQVQCFNSVSFRYWMSYDPTKVLKQIEIPVLAMSGELDLVIHYEQNLKQIALTLAKANHKDYTIVQLPKLNHMFQTCQTGSIWEYGSLEETTAPVVLSTMAEWILKRVK